MKARKYLFLVLSFVSYLPLLAQNAGDFKSVASGEWSALSTWQTYNGSGWVAATHYPAASEGYIIIGGGHNVTVPNAITIIADQVLVQENGQLLIDEGGTLELANGPGTDLDISNAVNLATPGTVKVRGLLKANNDALIASTANTLIIENGGTYQHHYTMSKGVIPSAAWNEGSSLLISGYTSNGSAPDNLGQAFHHVVWNTPDLNNSQGFINLGGALKTINGNFTVRSTGSSQLSIASENTSDILNIAQNFQVEGGSRVQINAAILVSGTLALSNSSLQNISGLSLADGATFMIEGMVELSGERPEAIGFYSLYFKDLNNSTTGLELPETENKLADLKIENSTIIITDPVTVYGDLILEPHGNLRLNSANISIKGNFVNNGTFVPGTNRITFNGLSPQEISGSSTTTFYNLEITNTASPGLTAHAPVNIEHEILLGENVTFDPDGGDLETDGGVNVTLISTALDQAAYLAPLPVTARVEGNLVLQHFIPVGKMYRYLSTATKGMTVGQWTDDFIIYGKHQGGPGGNASMNIYDEPTAKWPEYPGITGSLESPIQVGKGYAAYMYGEVPTIIDTRGEVTTGDFPFPLSYTANSPIPGDNFYGNPYPSKIEWSSPHWQRENVSATIELYKRVAGKNVYSALNSVTGIGLNEKGTEVASGQSFFIEALGAEAKLVATEKVKIATADKPAIQDVIVISFSNKTFKDETALAFREGATINYEATFDSKKKKNASINLYSKASDGKLLAQNLQPWFNCSLTFPLIIDQAPADVYQLSFSHLESLSRDLDIVLHDSHENKNISVTASTSYTFTITSDPLTYGPNRFVLLLNYKVPEVASVIYEESCGEEIHVTVNGTVAGKNYQLFSGNTALTDPVAATSDVTSFMVPATSLTEGNNTITIQGFHPGCEPVTMATVLELDYSGKYTISSTEGATSCTAAALILTATASAERAAYKWYKSPEATDAVFEGTSGTFTTPELEQNTTYYVAAVNAYGCESERVAVEAVILTTPEISAVSYEESCEEELPVTVNGTVAGKNYQLFSGTTALTDPVAATSDVTSFMVPATSLTEGNNTITIQGFHPGCEPVTMATVLELDYSGKYTISSTEGATSCTAAALSLTATASAERAGYKWYESPDATDAVFEGTSGAFTTPELEQSTTYYVAAVNAYGCESGRVAVEAVIQHQTPVIRIENGTIISSFTAGNHQWFLNGTSIAGATGSSFTPKESGTYGLEVTIDDCILQAEDVEFAVTGIDMENQDYSVSIYPNPAKAAIEVKGLLLENISGISYTIYQQNGTIVQQGSITGSNSFISIENLAQGFYLVRISAGAKIHYGKLIKI